MKTIEIVTIDGPAGVGKSSVARQVAQALGFVNLSTGAMYRAVTLAALRAGLLDSGIEADALSALLPTLSVEFGREGQLLLDGEVVTVELHSDSVNRHVSLVAAVHAVRLRMVALQRQIAAKTLRSGKGLVVEGRDIGSYVFPEAKHRFYLDATLEERTHRRHAQSGGAQSREFWLAQLRDRDQIDRGRDLAPLRVPPGATVIDTSSLTESQVVDRILRQVRLNDVDPI